MGEIVGDADCIACGACCASYRVSFYWAEAGELGSFNVPEAFTEKLNHYKLAMCGTNQEQPYCIALKGNVGEQVSCVIYENRPSPCREFEAGSDRCIETRNRHGVRVSLRDECA